MGVLQTHANPTVADATPSPSDSLFVRALTPLGLSPVLVRTLSSSV